VDGVATEASGRLKTSKVLDFGCAFPNTSCPAQMYLTKFPRNHTPKPPFLAKYQLGAVCELFHNLLCNCSPKTACENFYLDTIITFYWHNIFLRSKTKRSKMEIFRKIYEKSAKTPAMTTSWQLQ